MVSDNQIYVRDQVDLMVTGIRLLEPVMNVTVHDNLIRNCGTGIRSDTIESAIAEILDSTTFTGRPHTVPLVWPKSHAYRGWTLAWSRDGKPAGLSQIDSFELETLRFKLKEPREIKPDDHFEIYLRSANWNVHDNTITGCLEPVVLNSFGSETSIFRDNIISRDDVAGIRRPIQVLRGRFELTGNRVTGFDDAKAK